MNAPASAAAPTTIEILYFDGCPNHEQLVTRLRFLLDRERIIAAIVLHEVPDGHHARRQRFLRSPTVRVNGRDVEPGARERDDYGRKCRLYRTATGLRGTPPDEWILAAVRRS